MSLSIKEEDVKNLEYADAGRRKHGKFKRHCARFSWLYVVLLIVTVPVVVLPIVYVGYPRIAQDGINDSRLVPTAQVLQNPAPNAADITLDTLLLSDSSLHPDLDSFDADLTLAGRTAPFTTLRIPGAKAKNGTLLRAQQRIQIGNMDEFTLYVATLLAQPNFTVFVTGRGGLKQGALPRVNVDYNKTVQLTGLNSLKGFEITSFTLAQDLPYGANARGNTTIPNPSISSTVLGDVSLDLFVNQINIGNATLPDLNLTPGNNSYPIYASINQTAVVEVLSDPRYRCGTIPLSIKGNTSTFDGQVIPYFTSSLRLATLSTTFNLTDTLEEAGLGKLVNGSCEAS